MINKLLLLLILLLIPSMSIGQVGSTSPIFGQDACIWVEEEDGAPFNNYCAKLKVSNGSLTDNGDGSFSLTTSAGSGSGNVGIGTANWITYYQANGSTVVANDNIQLVGNNVGINSASPGVALDITGVVRASSDIKIGANSVCQSDGTNCAVSASSQWITTTGVGIGTWDNIGIGTTIPSYKVDIKTTTSADGVNINVAAVSDGCDSYTVLLTHANGADASTSFVEEGCASGAKGITANGNAQIDTADSKFGGASADLDGTGDYLSLADSDDWDFGTGNMTIDFWVKFDSFTGDPFVFFNGETSSPTYHGAQISTTNINWLYYSGGYLLNMNKTVSLSTGTWYHLAFIRGWGGNANDFAITVDGSIAGTVTTQVVTLPNRSESFIIGSYGGTGQFLNGHIDEYRINKGIARWTANFTPPNAEYYGAINRPQIQFQSAGATKAKIWTDASDSNKLKFNDDTDTNLVIDTSGNVGIGSVSPGQKLDIQGTIRASTDVKIGSQSVCQANGTNCPAGSSQWITTSAVGIGTTGNIGVGTYYPSAELHVSSNDANNLILVEDAGLSDASPFIISSTGNVGIGTTLTSATLSINQSGSNAILNVKTSTNVSLINISSTGELRWGHTSGGAAGNNAWFEFGNEYLASQGTDPFFIINPNGSNSSRIFEIRTDATPLFTVDAVGNIGITTNVPNARMDVLSADAYNAFSVKDQAGDTTPFVIDSTGNVGIGTLIVPSKLYVQGTGYFTTGLNIGIGTASPTRLCIANNAISVCP
jgi:hypothetical protein